MDGQSVNDQSPPPSGSASMEDGPESVEYQISSSSRRLHLRFFLFSFSILCSVSSFSGLMDLQSSINISDALGNKSLMVMSISTVLCCLFITPVMVKGCGAKLTLLTSQVCFVMYTLANFYPVSWTLLPGGLFLGVAVGLLYTPALMYCTYYGRRLAGMKNTNAKDHINKLVGYFWGIYQMNEIFSNTISTVVLGAGKSVNNDISPTLYNSLASEKNGTAIARKDSFELFHSTVALRNTTIPEPAVFSYLPNISFYYDSNTTPAPGSEVDGIRDFSMCGSNDCYNQAEYESHLDNYVPISSTALYIMIGIYAFLAVIAIPIMVLIPGLPMRTVKDDLNHLAYGKADQKISQSFRFMMSNLRKIAHQFINPLQLLLTPLTVYHGLYVSFVSSEISRGYVSCTMGVEQVGLAMLAGGITNVIVSFLFGHFAGRNICRNLLLLGAIALDLSLYIFCILWEPKEETVYYAFIICILFGLTDGVWSPFLDGKYAKYFPQNEEVAYSVHNVWEWAGLALTYAWTMAFCIRAKIYIQISMLIVGVIGCALAELTFKKNSKECTSGSHLSTKSNDEKLISSTI